MIEKIRNKTYTLLRKTEKYTKTDMVYLTKGGFWLSMKTLLSMMIALGLSIAFANLLPKETFGEYKYIFSIFGLLAIPTLLGMGSAVTKSVAQGYDGTPMAAIKTKILWGMLGSLASVLVAIYYFVHENMGLAGAFGIVAIFLPFVDTFSIFNAITTGKRLFKVSIIYETAIQTISGIAIALALFFTNNLLIILLSYFGVYTITRFITLQIVIRIHAKNKKVDESAIRYGKHLSAMRILGIASEAISTILLWQFVGAMPLAVYAFAKAIPVQISGALKKITVLAFPKFARGNFQEIRKTLPNKMLKMFLLMLIIVATYIISAPYIYTVLFPQYTDAILYSQIFALTLLFFPQKFMGVLFQAHARTKVLYISSTVTPIVRLILAIILIPLYGIMGAIFAEISTRIFSLLLVSFLFIRTRF